MVLSTIVPWTTRIRGLKSVAYILLGYIFNNREMAEMEKLDIRKVSKYPENFTLVNFLDIRILLLVEYKVIFSWFPQF